MIDGSAVEKSGEGSPSPVPPAMSSGESGRMLNVHYLFHLLYGMCLCESHIFAFIVTGMCSSELVYTQ